METLGSITVGEAAQLLIGKRYRGVLRRGREITSASSDESLHALRIRCKRLRYLLEFFRPTYGELLKAETTRLKELQDVLGEFPGRVRRRSVASPLRRRPTRAQRQPGPAHRSGPADRRPGQPGCDTPGPTSLTHGNGSIPRRPNGTPHSPGGEVTPWSPPEHS